MKKTLTIISLLVFFLLSGIAQTQSDTLFNYITSTPVTIDGEATEECWVNAEWNAIDQVWMPFGASMATGDFEGRFKVAWDKNYFYILVEVLDNMLSDDHANPLDNWWNDDCLEIFIDEDRSMGMHTTTCNAFAYHVSLSYDAIDLNASSNGINYKDHVEVEMDTIGENLYLWEMAFKIYRADYNHSNPEASRETLTPEKNMGLAVAYCDNDETTGRENFIGSMVMTQNHWNDMYQNADYFGLMRLVEPDLTEVADRKVKDSLVIRIYPSPAGEWLTIQTDQLPAGTRELKLMSLSGQLLRSVTFGGDSHTLDISDLESGAYIVSVRSAQSIYSEIVLKK